MINFTAKMILRASSAVEKAKWVSEKTELEYLRARVESMKVNILLMTTLHSMRKPGRCAH